MNDQENPDSEPEFDDPAYADLRALLADARATGPVPDDVAVRLEETLAALTSDRRHSVPDIATGTGVVVPLRRRSRVGSRLLAAAAAVIVVGAGGIGVSEVLRNTGNDQGVADSASSFAESDDQESVPGPAAPSAAPLDRPYDLNGGAWVETAALPKFTAAGFAAEAAAFRYPLGIVQDSLGLTPQTPAPTGADQDPPPTPDPDATKDLSSGGTTGGGQQSSAERQRLAYSAAKAACPGPVGGGAILVPIQYDGQPASLAIYPATEDGRRYEAWSCDGTILLASTVVPR